METRCEYLRSLVEGCPGRMVDDKKFLQGAQPARLGDRVVVGGPAQDVPGDGVWDVGVLQAPHVAGQHSIPPALRVGEIPVVTSPANLEVVRSETDVGLDTIVVLAGDGC